MSITNFDFLLIHPLNVKLFFLFFALKFNYLSDNFIFLSHTLHDNVSPKTISQTLRIKYLTYLL